MIYFSRPSSSHLFNANLKSELLLPEDQQCRLYPELSLALLEIFQGTIQFLAHKRSLVLSKGASMAHEFMLPQIYREGLNIQWRECHLPLDTNWTSQLKPDTGVCLSYEDHPITGEVFPWNELDQLMNDKKIFSIRVSHFAFFRDRDLKVSPYSVRLCVLERGVVLALIGNKFKVPTIFSNTLREPSMEFVKTEIKHKLSGAVQKNEALVADFESQMVTVGAAIWSYVGARCWDRSIIAFPNINADFLQKHMVELDPIYSQHIFTLVDCSAGFSKPLWNWWINGPDFEQQRGILILSAECLSWTKTIVELKKVIALAQQLKWEW